MNIKIKNVYFKVKVLTDSLSQKVGMMGKTFNDKYNGLLFLMGGEKQCFWMKDCIEYLDIIMIKNNVIVNIHHNCPPCSGDNCPSYCGKGNVVLEIKGGSCKELNIEPGDLVEYILN